MLPAFWKLMERGGPLMWPLLACSLVATTVFIERVWFWRIYRRQRDLSRWERLLASVRSRDWASAESLVKASRDPILRSFWAELQHHERRVPEAAQGTVQAEFDRMTRCLPVLDSVVTVAPLLGILGTVTGIIRSFDLLGAAGLKDSSAVTAGIAEALLTTAAGLVTAIPSVIAYNYFAHRASKAAKELERHLVPAVLPPGENRGVHLPSTSSSPLSEVRG